VRDGSGRASECIRASAGANSPTRASASERGARPNEIADFTYFTPFFNYISITFAAKINAMSKEITPKGQNYSEWYNDIVKKAQLAENAEDVRGCMVIRPYGFAIWENMRDVLDRKFKDTGHVNAYFPLLIPKSFLSKEAAHVEGFAKECAVVTHYRLKNDPNGGGVIVDPDAKLTEELIIRPTSETIIWNTYRNWIQSYRDLPLLINQWANVMRWEMRTRMFLRTSEFLWQEGHTAHATADEALVETKQMIDVYADFCETWMAMPVIKGVKSPNERFAGAVDTYTIEAMMLDGQALQSGTSHFLGQNFAKAFDVKFLNKSGEQEFVYATSWGVSTRLIGALIMAHSDDEGLVLPPKLAPLKVAIVPIHKSAEDLETLREHMADVMLELKKRNISFKFDDDDSKRPGFKFAEYELRGVPVRLAIGMRDKENGTIEIARRDERTKESVEFEGIVERIEDLLIDIQDNMYRKALAFRESRTYKVNDFEEFKAILEDDDRRGFILAHWDGTAETEQKIKELTKATIRCIPLDGELEAGVCILTGNPSERRVIFARAY
jgi:prolyl-tRNA synthetase